MFFKYASFLSLGILPLASLTAQFSFDFTEDEGFEAGDLVDSFDWAGSRNSFFVNLEGEGSLVINPTEPYRVARFEGADSFFEDAGLELSMRFRLVFEGGKSADIGENNAAALGLVQFENLIDTREFAGAGLRQTGGAGPGTFNFAIWNRMDGKNASDFASMFLASDLGLSYDDATGNWTNGQSDALELVYSLSEVEDGWAETASLKNTATGVILAKAAQVTPDSDGSFSGNPKGFRFNSAQISKFPVAVHVDKITVTPIAKD